MDKDDFESVLRVSYEREWTERLKVLSWLPQFKDWTMSELESSNTSCKLKEYPSGKVRLFTGKEVLCNLIDAENMLFMVLSVNVVHCSNF